MGIELMYVPKTSLLYFKDAIATKEASSMQTATMQPMWQPKNQLFNTTRLHEGWEKTMHLEYGNRN